MLICFVAKQASGKDTIINILKENNNVLPLISCTSREPRKGEVNGKEYYFKTSEEIIEMYKNNELIEYKEYKTQYGIWIYGLQKNELWNKDISKNNYTVILDLKGVKELKKYLKENNTDGYLKIIYIDAKPQITLMRALQRDNMDKDKCLEVCRRFIDDCIWEEEAKEYSDYIIPNNNEEDLENAIKFIKKLFYK